MVANDKRDVLLLLDKLIKHRSDSFSVHEKAFEAGCDKVVVILTRPEDYRRIPKNDKIIADLLHPHYPNASQAMRNRSVIYNQQLDECEYLQIQGKVCIVAPDSIGKMKTNDIMKIRSDSFGILKPL